jgi:hypothetical protein
LEWFKFHFTEVIGADNVSMCNATKGSGVPDNAFTWDGNAEWPLLLCSPSTLRTLLKTPGRPKSTLLLTIPAGRFPKGLAEQTKEDVAADRHRTLFEEEDVCLVLLRNTSATFTPSEQALEELTALLARFILLGPLGVGLNWGGIQHPLDHIVTNDGTRYLEETGLLQELNQAPPREWHPVRSWLGILPSVFLGEVGKAMKTKPDNNSRTL